MNWIELNWIELNCGQRLVNELRASTRVLLESAANEYHLITNMTYSARIAAFNVGHLLRLSEIQLGTFLTPPTTHHHPPTHAPYTTTNQQGWFWCFWKKMSWFYIIIPTYDKQWVIFCWLQIVIGHPLQFVTFAVSCIYTCRIAVNMDWTKCGAFSSFCWLSPDIYHINIIEEPNELDVHCGRIATLK